MSDAPTANQIQSYLRKTGWTEQTENSAGSVWNKEGRRLVVSDPVFHVLNHIAMYERRRPEEVRAEILAGESASPTINAATQFLGGVMGEFTTWGIEYAYGLYVKQATLGDAVDSPGSRLDEPTVLEAVVASAEFAGVCRMLAVMSFVGEGKHDPSDDLIRERINALTRGFPERDELERT